MNFDITNEKVTIEKEGIKKDYDVLFIYNSIETNKSYIGYTDNSIRKNGRKNICVSIYNSNKLEPITEEKDLEIVKNILREID